MLQMSSPAVDGVDNAEKEGGVFWIRAVLHGLTSIQAQQTAQLLGQWFGLYREGGCEAHASGGDLTQQKVEGPVVISLMSTILSGFSFIKVGAKLEVKY